MYFEIPENSMSLIHSDRFWHIHIPFGSINKFQFLHNSRWITLPTQLCLVLYSFYVQIICIQNDYLAVFVYKSLLLLLLSLLLLLQLVSWNHCSQFFKFSLSINKFPSMVDSFVACLVRLLSSSKHSVSYTWH